MRELLIGADIGTSAMKTVLVDAAGATLAVAESPYRMHHPHPGWAENDPEDWYRALGLTVRQVLHEASVAARDVRALCVVGQRDPAVLVDDRGGVLTPAIHWTDRREPDKTERLYAEIGRERLIDITGVVPVTGLVLPNLAWTKRHRPEVWNRARWALQPKDFLALRLVGDASTDTSSPSRSMLNDWRARSWSDELIGEVEFPREIFPPVAYRPWEVRGRIVGPAADEIGLAPGTILAAGGGDDQSAALGSGVIEVGDVSLGTGSSMAWRLVTRYPTVDPRGQMCLAEHVVPDRFLYELIAIGTGTSLRWFRDAFGAAGGIGLAEANYEGLIDAAAAVAPGSDGLLFYPYLTGASLPYEHPRASGVFFGIQANHTPAHFVRAIMEGIAYLYPGMLEIVARNSETVRSMTIIDGEARSGIWNQIKADISGHPIETTGVPEASAMGGAILAGVAAGTFRTPDEGVRALVTGGETIEPDPAGHRRYREQYAEWERIRGLLWAAFDPVAT